MVESNHFKKPLLRWAGGKWHLLKILIENIPDNVKNHIYIEPFLGAGSLFFYLQPESAIISDANSHLIKFYENLRDYPLEICNHLIFLKDQSNKDFYYKIRDIYNNSDFSPKQAARFLYLNRTCFNAIFRVNKKDKFNVPYGWKEPPSIPSKN